MNMALQGEKCQHTSRNVTYLCVSLFVIVNWPHRWKVLFSLLVMMMAWDWKKGTQTSAHLAKCYQFFVKVSFGHMCPFFNLVCVTFRDSELTKRMKNPPKSFSNDDGLGLEKRYTDVSTPHKILPFCCKNILWTCVSISWRCVHFSTWCVSLFAIANWPH